MERTRREVLVTALRLAAGSLTLAFPAIGEEAGASKVAATRLSEQLADRASLERVGHAVAAQLPEASDAEALARRIAPERGALALRREIVAQHRAGETVRIRGWSLALTEARIYALLALDAASDG